MKEKALPQNIEAEQAILGSIVLDPEVVSLVIDTLAASDFYRDAHQEIYRAMVALTAQQRQPDFITLCDYLESHRKLEQVGGASYLSSLVNEVPTSGNIEYHAQIVRNKAIARRLIHAAGRIAAVAYEEADNALETAEQLIYEVAESTAHTDLVPGPVIMSDFLLHLDSQQERLARHVVGLPTGFDDLDTLLGGMQPQELYVLGGRPGTGKTSLMLTIVRHLLFHSECKIAIFSLEMSKNDVARRLISMESGIDSQRLRFSKHLLSSDEWDKIVLASDRLSLDRFAVDESGDLSIAAMRSKARRHKMRYGLDLIVVDYLQLMAAESDEKRFENRVVEVGKISRGLKQLAKSLDVPVLALAQLSRAVESRAVKRPQLSDLRESGSIEADSDVVMFISNHPEKRNYSILEIAKHRNGPVGEDILRFIGPLTTFEEVSA